MVVRRKTNVFLVRFMFICEAVWIIVNFLYFFSENYLDENVSYFQVLRFKYRLNDPTTSKLVIQSLTLVRLFVLEN